MRHFSNAAPRRTMMISSLSVIADLAAHHGKQLGNEMPASFTVNAKRSGSEGPRHREPPASSAGEPWRPPRSQGRVAHRAPGTRRLGGPAAHDAFFCER